MTRMEKRNGNLKLSYLSSLHPSLMLMLVIIMVPEHDNDYEGVPIVYQL